jgi:hypothetical protein
MAKYLDPKNDVVFKKIFGEHPRLLISFLNALLKFEDGGVIINIEYLKDELIPANPLKQRSIVDVRWKDSNGRQFIVERNIEFIQNLYGYQITPRSVVHELFIYIFVIPIVALFCIFRWKKKEMKK